MADGDYLRSVSQFMQPAAPAMTVDPRTLPPPVTMPVAPPPMAPVPMPAPAPTLEDIKNGAMPGPPPPAAPAQPQVQAPVAFDNLGASFAAGMNITSPPVAPEAPAAPVAIPPTFENLGRTFAASQAPAAPIAPSVVAPARDVVGVPESHASAPAPVAPVAPVATEAPAQQQQSAPVPSITAISGGTSKAHEVDLLGPQQKAAIALANATAEKAIGSIAARTIEAASIEKGMLIAQEKAARAREDAAAASQAEREEEMQARAADFDASVKAMGKMSVNPDRFWQTRSTGQTIGHLISMTLGGFLQGARGGSNPGADQVNALIERDIKAQEFAYGVAKDKAEASRTGFGMAMQKYGSVDAARNMTRAAALDGVAAQLEQQKSVWKGTDAANKADGMIEALGQRRAEQVVNGLKYVQAQQGAQMFKVDWSPVPVTRAELMAHGAKAEEHGYKLGEQDNKAEGDYKTEVGKALLNHDKGKDDKIAEQTRFVAEKLQGAGVPQARQMAERALKALGESEGGVGEAAVRGVTGDALGNRVLSAAAAEREQAYADYVNTAIKATMGNATADEVGRAMKGQAGIADPAGRKRAVQATLKTLEAIEKNALGGVSPEAQAQYHKQRDEAQGSSPAAPAGAKKGWK